MSSVSASSSSVGGGTASTVAASSIGPNHRNSVSPAPMNSGRASAPAMGVGRSRTPTSTPIHSVNVTNDSLEQRMTAFERLTALQNQELLQQQILQHHHQQQQQQYEAAMAQSAAAAVAAAAAGQVVGRQGPIKDVRSIIEDYRQKHPESVPRRGRRMKTVPKCNTSGGSDISSSSLLMMMANQSNMNSNQNNTGGGCGGGGKGSDVVDFSGAFALLGDLSDGGVKIKSGNKKAGGSNINVAGAAAGRNKSPVERAKDRQRGNSVDNAAATVTSRRDSEWQAMLNSLSESGTTSATSLLSRPSSAESLSQHSTASVSAINSLLTQHGLLPAISVTSLSGGAGGGSGGGGGEGGVGVNSGAVAVGGRGSVNGNYHS